jgi:tRNA nucleotidyltransferase (CCA-adding enzyme)
VKVVVSHSNMDFDALASMALARLLHPGAVAVVLGGFEDQVRTFVRLYRKHLELVDAGDVALEEVSELIVVDTADPKRIAPFDELFERVPVTVYDHHPKVRPSIPAGAGLCRQVGATTTILTLLLKVQNVAIPAELASLGLLGIHEDTGNLSYALTTPDDYEAAAHLLRSGGRLELVREFSKERYSAELRSVLQRLLETAEEHLVKDRRVVVASYVGKDYVSGIAPLSHRLMEFFDADAVLIAACMDGRSLLIARAKADTIDVGAALETLGGGGHAVAAFASTQLPLDDAIRRALEAFSAHAARPRTAGELMSQPVISIHETATLLEARDRLERHGYSGLTVVDGRGKLVGTISRREIDRALRHGLGAHAVKSFMNKTLITANEATSQRELERLIQEHDVGRVPIVRDDQLVGIVTRSDLLGALHRKGEGKGQGEEDLAWQVLASLPAAAAEVLDEAKRQLAGGTLYLVGGTVRDALLKVGMQDLDLVVEGDDAERLGSALQARLGGQLACHFGFGTCALTLPGSLTIDIATAREEYYSHPGALPEVSPSSLQRDLARRDFSLNAIALRVAPEPLEVIDPFGGLEDLADRCLRSLHSLSFVEDPTRILRGARLAARLGLRFHPDTRAQVPAALAPQVLRQVSKSRLRQELLLCCAERQVAPVMALLDDLEVVGAVFSIRLDLALISRLDEMRAISDLPDESYMLALLLGFSEEELRQSADTFFWPKRWLEALKVLREARAVNKIDEAAAMSLDPAARAVLRALGPELSAQLARYEAQAGRQRLRGRDVLDLGLGEGPEVGKVLAEVKRARADGRAASFEEELELARRLVAELLASREAVGHSD